jgi:DNA-binding protein H-NS
MRKPKDFDSKLKALDERAKQLKTRKLHQLGGLVVATGADALPVDVLAGALLAAREAKGEAAREGWRARGAAFFQQTNRKQGSAHQSSNVAPPSGGGTLPLGGGAGAK